MLNHLENLTIGGIIINCYASYFTSKTYTAMFVGQTTGMAGAATAPKAADAASADSSSTFKISTGWNELDFFIFVVIVEHAVLFMKLVINNLLDDKPETVQKGEEEKKALIQNFKDNMDDDEKCKIWKNKLKLEKTRKHVTQFMKMFKKKLNIGSGGAANLKNMFQNNKLNLTKK